MKILIIDKSSAFTESLSNFFNSKGIISITTNDAMEGLQNIRQKNFAAILLDIDMSVISDLGIIDFLAGDDILKNQNLFIISENKIPEVKLRYLLRKEGIKGILKKSKTPEEFFSAIFSDWSQKKVEN
jgi:CheY-like chemotaxis protein